MTQRDDEKEKLLACPFCSAADIALHPNDIANGGDAMGIPNVSVFYAHCDGCGAEGPQASDEVASIAAWNLRAAPSSTTLTDATCPKCKGSGEVQRMTQHLGPDDYEVTVECFECKGTGAVPSATGITDTGTVAADNAGVSDRWQDPRDLSGGGTDMPNADPKSAALKKDAARYRWLRDLSVPPHNFYIAVPDEFHGVRYTPHEVDAAIDAALLRPSDSNAAK